MTEVLVVGAGVVGLTTALTLVEKGYKVKVIGAHFPNDSLSPKYTSHWAGAHFRPAPASTEKEIHDQRLTRVTLHWFKHLAVDSPESSIRFVEGIDYLEKKGKYGVHAVGYHEELDAFEELTKDELPEGVEFGASYRTWVLNAPLYVQFLQRKLIFEYGVEFIKTELFSLKQVAEIYSGHIIVNATGLGLQYNGGYDSEAFWIRGQTLLVKAPGGNPYFDKTVTHQSKNGEWTFVISRPLDGGFIIGGTKQLNDLESNPRQSDTDDITERARKLFPELFIDGKLDIRYTNVGFRPGRKNGIKIELEKPEDGVKIIHAYGAGGMGFELSRGIAEEVLHLIIKNENKL